MTPSAATGRPPALRWVLALTAVAGLIVALDQLVVATALNTIRRDLGASMADLEWTVNAFGLGFAALLIPAAELGDRIGRKRAYLSGLLLFAAASAACALAPTTGVLIGARAVQGAAAALLSPAALALLTEATPPRRRGAVMGVYAAVTGLAVVGGPLVGGAVAEGLAWQWIFWINVPVIAVVVPIARSVLTEHTGRPAPPDVPGIVLAAGSMYALVWALVRSGSAGWGSAEVLGTLVAGGVALAAFAVRQATAAHPMLPTRLLRQPAFAAGNLSSLLLTASLFGTVFFLAQYLQVALGHSPLGAGLRFLPWTATLFFVAPVAGRLQDRIGPRTLICAGLFLQGAGMLWIGVNAHQHQSYGASVAALVLSGAGTSMAMPAQQTTVMTTVPPALMGKAAGTFNTVRQLGGALGIAVMAAVFGTVGGEKSPAAFADGFSGAVTVAAALALAGAACGLFAPGRPRAAAPAAPVGDGAGEAVQEELGAH
ncbi:MULTISPECIES: MFS transporter [Streptomyces]|uniref:MFS transporter n=1 Tax=Streptomyces flaveolus TaxID=67297 RepID=A0ABV3AMK6_9ACTN|nr:MULTISPECIES: MFS transporter [Streptomyces]KMS83457.1 MFS transporter [Streptomyces regensis]